MKLLCAAILVLITQAFAADGPVFGAKFPKFQPPSVAITWAAPTNNRPAALWVYKVVPQKFSETVISNLMDLGPFTATDRNESLENGLELVYAKQNRFLMIALAGGWIRYRDNKADSATAPIQDVPDEKATQERALILLDKIGISRSDLVTKPGGTNFLVFGEANKRGRFDKQSGNAVEQVSVRGIYFVRKLDGISFAGIGNGGGFHASFGSHGALVAFDLIWRNLEPYEHRKVANSDDIVRFITDGKAVITHRNLIDTTRVRKLIIKEVAPFYMGASWMDHQDFVYPFAQLETVADLGSTNSPLQLYCPILTEEKVH